MLGRWWWTAVSRNEVEDGSELVDNAVALCKKSSFPQRDPSPCRGRSAATKVQKNKFLLTLVFPVASLYLLMNALLNLPL